MSIEIIQSHSFQVGDVTVSFTIGRIGKTAEPVGAAVSTGNDLRAPAAAASGQIVREGDAPREPVRQASEQSQGGGVSSPDTELKSDGDAIAAVTGKAQLANANSVEPPPSVQTKPKLSKAEQIRTLRPNCRHADDLDKCAGVGRKHCRGCAAVVESEAA